MLARIPAALLVVQDVITHVFYLARLLAFLILAKDTVATPARVLVKELARPPVPLTYMAE